MKRKHIDFRELLEKLLPLDELPSADRFRVHRALKTGLSPQVEQAALLALTRLEQQGTVERLSPDPAEPGGGPPRLTYRTRDALDVITLELPEPRERDGVRLIPRASLPVHASAGLEALRRLMRLDDAFVTGEGAGEARPGFVEHLSEVGREFLAARDVRFFPVNDGTESSPSVDAALGLEARGRLDLILYAPDTLLSSRLRGLAGRGVRALVLVGVSASDGAPLGHLEILSGEADPFRPEDLAMAALLADLCGGTLERAARIEKLVFVDPLTTVYNRSYFDLQLKNEMARARREGASMALCIVDIDDFKSFNTGYGYDAGNQVLIQVAQSLTHGVRPFDTVARWGGEEFAVLLTAPVQPSDVVEVAERLRMLVGRLTVPLEGLDGATHEAGVTVSLGVAMFPQHGTDPRELWRAANRALLEAKRPPKNQVVFYSTG